MSVHALKGLATALLVAASVVRQFGSVYSMATLEVGKTIVDRGTAAVESKVACGWIVPMPCFIVAADVTGTA